MQTQEHVTKVVRDSFTLAAHETEVGRNRSFVQVGKTMFVFLEEYLGDCTDAAKQIGGIGRIDGLANRIRLEVDKRHLITHQNNKQTYVYDYAKVKEVIAKHGVTERAQEKMEKPKKKDNVHAARMDEFSGKMFTDNDEEIFEVEGKNRSEKFVQNQFKATDAIPGSVEKLEILALRVQLGLPLWHPNDRQNYDRTKPHED